MIAQVALVCLVVCSATALPAEYPGALYSQYHAQDELGQYTFGYSGPSSTKHEQKTADGVTRGTYSYVDPRGQLQTRSYTADDVNGFRVTASDLPVAPASGAVQGLATSYASPGYKTTVQTTRPGVTRWSLTSDDFAGGQVQDTAEVVAAKAQHFAAVEQAKIRNSAPYYATSAAYPLEHRYLTAPVSAVSPYATEDALYGQQVALPGAIRSQYHAQDEAGQYTFGYSNEVASKSETKTLDGVTRGSYSYVDPYGQIQSRSYVADQDGFRVVASDLPQVNV